jgi:RNA polymerase sigma-70 factor (ECF subfamily)
VKEAIVGLSEHFLVWRLRRGDREACRELVRRHHQGVYGYLRRLGAEEALAEDLTQDTYAKAWRRIGSLRQSSSLRSWLLTIARNEFLQWVRVERPEVRPLDEAPEEADDGPGVERRLELSERDRDLRRAVVRLQPDLQESVALHYFQDLSFREVAAVLNVPPGTVKSRINRALRSLRVLLEPTEADHERPRAEKTFASDS